MFLSWYFWLALYIVYAESVLFQLVRPAGVALWAPLGQKPNRWLLKFFFKEFASRSTPIQEKNKTTRMTRWFFYFSLVLLAGVEPCNVAAFEDRYSIHCILYMQNQFYFNWYALLGSNQQPTASKTATLSIELRALIRTET
ncbi:MAG: hypothetical protein ACD_2C00097G0008 [uncultured bacterium (gcode 4)]|uniref:Uncharacterized protein n=1 Tax=uncultured bacterium (gcode 4) TaxID=1234023 RepID=K2H1R2_9BACT|nr:MAG: hypothetical protein ACD_2C00097G0008 [uncultured bacterium (gcode 4)]